MTLQDFKTRLKKTLPILAGLIAMFAVTVFEYGITNALYMLFMAVAISIILIFITAYYLLR